MFPFILKNKKGGNVKRRNVHHGMVANAIAIVEGHGGKGMLLQFLTEDP